MRRLDDRREIVRPTTSIAIRIGVRRLAGQAVAAKVIHDDAVPLKLGAPQLRVPVQAAAEESVNEDNGGAIGVSRFLDSQHDTVRRSDGVAVGICECGR